MQARRGVSGDESWGRSCGSLVALLPGTNCEGQSVEMKEPKNGDWTINAGEAAIRARQTANFRIG